MMFSEIFYIRIWEAGCHFYQKLLLNYWDEYTYSQIQFLNWYNLKNKKNYTKLPPKYECK